MTDPQAAPLSAEDMARCALQWLEALGAAWPHWREPALNAHKTITALQGELAEAQNGWTKALNTASDYLIRAEAAESALKASPHGGMRPEMLKDVQEWKTYIHHPDRIHTTLWLGNQLKRAERLIDRLTAPDVSAKGNTAAQERK